MADRSEGRRATRARAALAAADAEHEAVAVRAAASLKAPERADPTFAERVMAAVRDEARRMSDESAAPRPAAWWRRSVTVRLSPLRALAMAAGLTAITVGVAEHLSRPTQGSEAPRRVASTRDTVHLVRFVFVAPGASSVALVGDFNRWDVGAHRLVPAGTGGVWSVTIPLTPGRHEYAYVINGTRWVVDPRAPAAIADEFGGESSIVTVSDPRRPRAS